MKNLFSIMITTARAQVTRLLARFRRFTSGTFLRAQFTSKLRGAFAKLFDIKPRDRKDYYVIFRWMVSKRLAFALVVITGMLCGYYIYSMMPDSAINSSGNSYRTYKYNALPLKFYKGDCSILDKEGRLAYSGNVEKAECTGNGTLFDKNGNRVYAGNFDNNMFNGQGVSYYPDGTTKHTGSYVDNLYDGSGTSYYPSGVMKYNGEFSQGMQNGVGTLYSSSGSEVFSGTFLKDSIVFEEFVGKSTEDIAAMYLGKPDIYSAGSEQCVLMKEIDAVYSAKDGSDSLEDQWTVERVIVLCDTFKTTGGSFKSIQKIINELGKPNYLGSTEIDLSEAVAINSLKGDLAGKIAKVDMSLTDSFEEVHNVNSFDDDYEMFIYSFQSSDLVYTFYCAGSGVDEFVMYSIEAA